MPLARGSRLGPYRIEAAIGAGGMGHVFRATDTRLERSVAIKVLPPHRWSDPELRHRMEREARALSALNHPNVCALYDIGEFTANGTTTPYLVMELLEGETLRDRLAKAPVSIRRALQWGAQIASGLAAAHDKGVVHRDLKPENVVVTNGDLLKVLDFGLARENSPEDDAPTQLRTQTGFVMGTAEYMSPEQARGSVVGSQSDIFSLGIVLYEMLTGQTPFHRASAVETMNAILVDDPAAVSSVTPAVPDAVDALVARCLEKDPAQRFSSARDLAYALDSASRAVTTSAPKAKRRSSKSQRIRSSRATWLGLAAILLLSILGAGAIARAGLFRRSEERVPPRVRSLTYSGRDTSPAISPDGRLLAFVSTRDGHRRIWLKSLADGTEVAVTAGPADSAPRFSPDGSVLFFTRVDAQQSSIQRVAVLGGEPRKVIANGFDADPSPDRESLAFLRNRQSGRDRVATVVIAGADGSREREIVRSLTDEFSAPRWSPDGRLLAVTRNSRASAPGSVLLFDVESGEQRDLVHASPHSFVSSVAWLPDSRGLLYLEVEAVGARGLPQRRGGSSLVLHDLDGEARILMRHPHGAADTIDLLADGRVVFTEDATRQNLQEVSLATMERQWITGGMSSDRQPTYGRAGNSIVFTSDRGENVELWEVALPTLTIRRLTDDAGIDWDPHPTADGRALYWSSDRSGHFEIWTSAPDGASPRQVTRDGRDAENPSVPADGAFVYYDSTSAEGDGLRRRDVRSGATSLIAPGETIHPEVSHDGRYVVYQRPEASGAAALDVIRTADGARFTCLSGVSGVTLRARWFANDTAIAFRGLMRNGRVAVFAQDFQFGVDTSSTRRLLVDGGSDASIETFAISPDGTRAAIAVLEDASSIMVAEGVRVD